MDPFIAQIIMFGGTFAPRGWAFCNGQLLSIAQNQTLFSILGTTYGGDGRTTFGLPDLRGRAPVHAGNGPGLSPTPLGKKGGLETVALIESEMPIHTHGATGKVKTGPDTDLTDVSEGNLLAHEARGGGNALEIYTSSAGSSYMADDSTEISVSSAGGGQPHENRMPYTAINFIISLQGVYPSRN